ncbi:hypothetical protein SAMN05661091_1365 [Paenibacillus uliginis N3/975]|uniref:Uncharacterized protein n=1 Tax=Paenibacillus uliginis N3/975 TaxID=1313296 RepID=A0A1X7GZ95_9BACL|nr:hypothetical protein SAMN05661091_1365 [Paenibacillus uliginis N3/975]
MLLVMTSEIFFKEHMELTFYLLFRKMELY